MNCERSRKRDLIKMWGMKELAKGKKLRDLEPQMALMQRKTVAELEQVVSKQGAL